MFRAISFGCHESSQFLIGYSVNYLIVWDIKTCSVKWQMEADVQLLAVDPYSKYFATCIRFEGDHKTHGMSTSSFSAFLKCKISGFFALWPISLGEYSIVDRQYLGVNLKEESFHLKSHSLLILFLVYVFDPASPSPAALFYKINKHFDVPTAAIFTPRKKLSNFKNVWDEMGHFYILTNNTVCENEVYAFIM